MEITNYVVYDNYVVLDYVHQCILPYLAWAFRDSTELDYKLFFYLELLFVGIFI